jgi:hypothetical protein
MALTVWRGVVLPLLVRSSLEPMEKTNVRSTCCSFGVNQRMIKEHYGQGDDQTEVRVNSCIGFFSRPASALWSLSLCVCCASCLVADVVRPDLKEPKSVAEKAHVPLVLVCLRL